MGTSNLASTPTSSMRGLVLILVLSLAISCGLAKKAGKGGKGGKGEKPAKKEPEGLCLTEKDMMNICHAGSTLGEKANAAMAACSASAEERAKKGKGKKG